MRTSNLKCKPYILFSGPTGVGKSTIINFLKNDFNSCDLFSDPYELNPFIRDAYENEKYTFQSQLFFFKEFLKIHNKINKSQNIIFQERSIFESINIFCKMFALQGKFSTDELNLLIDLYDITASDIRQPSLIFYFEADASEIIGRIKKRDRKFENSINEAFINCQQNLYEDWLSGCKYNFNIPIVRINAARSPMKVFTEVQEVIESIIFKQM